MATPERQHEEGEQLMEPVRVQPGESFQAAIDAASPGDVIYLAEGEEQPIDVTI